MKALSVGRLVYDINIMMDGYPIEGSENVTKEMITCSGGSTNIIAYSLGKWNMESFISGVIGYDETGTTMKKNMEENRVRTNFLETNYDIKTPTSYIFINKQKNSRTVVNAEINDFNIKKYDYDTDIDCVVVDGYEYNASVYAFNKYSKAITVLNAKTPHNGLLDFFKYAKYVVASSDVAEAMTGMKIDFDAPVSMVNVYKKIIDKYPHITLFITIEGKGTIYSVNNEIKVLATMNTEIVDKTGARDIFVAMIGYGITNGYDIETTIRLATIAESMSKKTIGSTLSIPLLSDIIKYYESKFGDLKNNSDFIAPSSEEKSSETIPKATDQTKIEVVQETNTSSAPPEVKLETLETATNSQTDEQLVSQVFGTTPNNNNNDNAPTA